MAGGASASAFEQLKADALAWRPQNVQRSAWAQVFLGCLTQISGTLSFPSYNCVLGFMGLYIVFTRSLQACNVYIWFLNISLILDVVFIALWGSKEGMLVANSAVKFGLSMFIINAATKMLSVYFFTRLHKELVSEQLAHARQGVSDRRQSLAIAMAQERKVAKNSAGFVALPQDEGREHSTSLRDQSGVAAPISGSGSPRSPAARSEESFGLSPAGRPTGMR